MSGRGGTDGPHRGCRLCGAGGSDGSTGTTLVAHVDADFVALVDVTVPGVLLAPRSHVDVLATGPVRSGAILGALRRAAITVQASFGASGTSIEPTTELPGAPGHVCYRVVPVVDGVPLPPGSGPGVDPQDLAAALRNAVAGRDTPAPG